MRISKFSIRRFAKSYFIRLGLSKYWFFYTADELRLLFIRFYGLVTCQRLKASRLSKRSVVQLNFGCGDMLRDGWIGVDCVRGGNVDLVLDLRLPLPFADASVDSCYSSHFLEHLYPEEGLRHLEEVCRILKAGQIYRVVVPDVMKFAERYLAGDIQFFQLAFPWANRPMEALYSIANWEGRHRNMLDLVELKVMGAAAGFSDVVLSCCNGSEVEELNIDDTDPQRVAESLYVEFHKPGLD